MDRFKLAVKDRPQHIGQPQFNRAGGANGVSVVVDAYIGKTVRPVRGEACAGKPAIKYVIEDKTVRHRCPRRVRPAR